MNAAVETLSAQALAERFGVVDAMVFRRVTPSTWAHLGGLGRGRGWAGLVHVDADDDPLVRGLPGAPGQVARFGHVTAERILGPYYAVGGALVRVSNDVVVVLGNPTQLLPAETSDDDLRDLAGVVDQKLEDIAPSKRLGDELELLYALRALTTGSSATAATALQHIVDVAAGSLSCELGLVRDGAGHTALAGAWTGIDVADPAFVSALDALQARAADAPVCIQDIDSDPLLHPLGREQGFRSVLAVAVPPPAGGMLVLIHTDAGPRGFTALCQTLGGQLADAASVVAHTAALREELRAAVEDQAMAARRDPLTGLGNRLAWDEGLEKAQQRVDDGGCVTIVTIDVDGLKRINDTYGHHCGDDLLRRCAAVLREHSRAEDVTVRLGGDEFALLLPIGERLAAERVESLRAVLGGGATSCRETVAASLGTASAAAGASVSDAARNADAAMYADKRARRVFPAGISPD